MKGLFIKDFKLMKMQRNFFFVIIAISVGMALFSDDSSFVIGFFPFVLSLFTLSTISYDEFDNGNAFLFTLPVSRTDYVVEKYGLALLLGGGAWVLAMIFSAVSGIWKGTAAVLDITMSALMILPALIALQAVMIPFQLKFGGEKGRIALLGALGGLCMLGIAAAKAAQMFGIPIEDMIDRLPIVSMGVMAAALIAGAAILLLVSMKISIRIMKNKEL